MSLLSTLPTLSDGGYHARVLDDTTAPSGARLTSFELTFPRFILSEVNTHRVLSKNSASSRAVPVSKSLRNVLLNPFVPTRFGVNEPGMQASAFLEGDQHLEQVENWLRGRGRAVWTALESLLGQRELELVLGPKYWHELDPFTDHRSTQRVLEALEEFTSHVTQCRRDGVPQTRYLNVHKQSANRVLEPYAWHTAIITGTQWSNFYALRDHPDAQPEIAKIASMARELHASTTPRVLRAGQWHLPLLTDDERSELERATGEELVNWLLVAVGRCARVSYETHDGRRDLLADAALARRLASHGHMSPFEHVAMALEEPIPSGNLLGYEQYRKRLPHESDYSEVLAAQLLV